MLKPTGNTLVKVRPSNEEVKSKQKFEKLSSVNYKRPAALESLRNFRSSLGVNDDCGTGKLPDKETPVKITLPKMFQDDFRDERIRSALELE